ncbi:MAG: LPS-assembly protein LptD [Bauldia sp.]|uniref:LPS-assembly protein LptD n=1 Tax=Bauldia sp. TaxID=2575872 RepID=UPI001D752872|nr:LPS-assembly protein LptD [Bauldia sp.]MCB1495899.1 LPS-assembly protein LptD [Bauldia sp.]
MRTGGIVRVLMGLKAAFGRSALLPAIAGAALLLAPVLSSSSSAQDFGFDQNVKIKRDAQMLVESDELVYDYDNHTVSAVGNVKIYYVGYTLEAEKVIYIEVTAKLIASGGVKMTDPSGVVVYAEVIDITDDFRDGFVGSLRVDTPDQTHFAAERAERVSGEQTVFYNGVYTACEPCKEHPEKPPLWQVKSAKIIVNDKEKEIEFHNATFEFFGLPLAWIPYFTTADPSVKRKTGFLAPVIGVSDTLGWSAATPYFIALAPSYDVTLTPKYYQYQGFLGEVEWRQRLRSGQYTLTMAGINQDNPKKFLKDPYTTASGKTAYRHGNFSQDEFRGGIRSTGRFSINKNWTFGWDGTVSTDRTFTRDYDVLNQDTSITTSEVHLTGLQDRNYLDARAEYFQVLTDDLNPKYEQGRQAVITPVIDGNHIFKNPVLGGQLSLISNLTTLSREKADPFTISGQSAAAYNGIAADGTTYYRGLAGDYVRLSEELAWEKKMIIPGGQVLSTFASLRGDVFSLDTEGTVPQGLTNQDTPTRLMPTAGATWSYPILASLPGSSHVFEPIAQIVARPDEPLAGKLENDDAQSLIFDDTTLLREDKFSGYDRVEGGTRVNYGIHYAGTFDGGMTIDGLFGQSYMLDGKNSFAVNDITGVGAYSGLESRSSDYVGHVGLDTGRGTQLSMRGRFDQEDFAVNYGEVGGATRVGVVTASATYVYAREQPTAGKLIPTSQITAAASVELFDRWRAFGTAVYDFNASQLRKDSIGIGYDDSCVTLSIAYSETRGIDIPDRSIMVKLLLRTLAEGTVSSSIQ